MLEKLDNDDDRQMMSYCEAEGISGEANGGRRGSTGCRGRRQSSSTDLVSGRT